MTDNIIKTISSSFIEAWDRCLIKLQKQLNPQVFKSYIENLVIEDFDENQKTAIIYTQSKFISKYVDQHFKYLITSNLNDILGYDVILRFVENPNIKKEQPPITVIKRPANIDIQNYNYQNTNIEREIPQNLPNELNANNNQSSQSFVVPNNLIRNKSTNYQTLNTSNNVINKQYTNYYHEKIGVNTINRNYTFSNFIVGNNSALCHGAAKCVAERPGEVYNPLFIYGGSGLGKTHLLHAIGNEVLANHPDYEVVYLTSEQFVNYVVYGITFDKIKDFKERIRNVNVLLIDDIQFLLGKDRTQEEFFNTFNVLYNSRHQIVMTSDKMPRDIPGIEERLLTRFSWGLITDIQVPDFETRVAILNRKAENENIHLDEDVAHWIAEHIFSNVRELEGALTRLHAVSSLQQVPINIELVENIFQYLYKPKKINITVEDIKSAVAHHFNIKPSDIISKRRTRNLSFPRHIAMYLCRKHTTSSYPEIGAKFGGRDHSSVIHATNVVSKKLENDPEVQIMINDIEKRLLN